MIGDQLTYFEVALLQLLAKVKRFFIKQSIGFLLSSYWVKRFFIDSKGWFFLLIFLYRKEVFSTACRSFRCLQVKLFFYLSFHNFQSVILTI